MTPDDLKSARNRLGYSTRELAKAIGVEQAEVLSWERGDTFPTKKWVERIAALPPHMKPASKKSPSASAHPLADPEVWRLIRKLLAHAELRARTIDLAASYPDPADD